MSNHKDQLLQEYVKRFKQICYLPLRFSGFNRFEIRDGQIVGKSTQNLIYVVTVALLTNLCVMYLFYIMTYANSYLLVTEILLLLHFTSFHNSLVININYINRNIGAEFINGCIKLDAFLGSEETKFMRDVEESYYKQLSFVALCMKIVGIASVIYTFSFVPFSAQLTGLVYFLQTYACYYDNILILGQHAFHAMRIRYLNVALMKTTKMKPEYLANQTPFYGIFWKSEFDDNVTFHNRSNPDQLIQAYVMTFEQMDLLKKYFSFTVLLCATFITFGSFITTQSFVIYVKSADVDTLRVAAVGCWACSFWLYVLSMSTQADMFQRQIQQTSLICTYTQLKPSTSNKVYKLTKRLLRTLKVRECRLSVFGLFYYDSGQVVRMFASILVYITAHLQLAFPVATVQEFPNTLFYNTTIRE